LQRAARYIWVRNEIEKEFIGVSAIIVETNRFGIVSRSSCHYGSRQRN